MSVRFVSVSLLAVCLVACSKSDEKSPTPGPTASAESQLVSLRAGWKQRWGQYPPLPQCPGLAVADQPLCTQALAKREALKQAEEQDAPPERHLTLAAEAADAAAAAGAKLELTYLQRLVLNAQPDTAGSAAPSAAPSGAAAVPPVPAATAPVAKAPAPSASADHNHAKDSIKDIVAHAKHGETRDKDPLQVASAQYYGAERDALVRVAGYIREGAPADRERAITLFAKHAERYPKSHRARQLLNEAIILVSDKELRQRLGVIRAKMGPGAVPVGSAG